MGTHILALDQGTTSSRAILLDAGLVPVAMAQQEFAQHYPRPGWVEHEPEDLWTSTIATARAAIAKAGVAPRDIAAIGIANQRETCLIWERRTGRPIHRAIVWQDRRTAEACRALKEAGHEPLVARKTGLLLDPYFSASKLAWLLDTVPGATCGRARRARLRHDRQLAAVAADRRARSCDRRHQRLPHPAARHPYRPLGR